MNVWTSQSKPGRQLALALGSAIIGLVLITALHSGAASADERAGRNYPLFAPGRFFPGRSDRSTVEGWRRRVAESLGLPA